MKHPKKDCYSKVRYHTPNEAWYAALSFFKGKGFDNAPYLCPDCLEYHLTKQRRLVPKFIRDLMK